MQIKLIIPDELVESVVKDIMCNFPEASQGSALVCTRWKYDKWDFLFKDDEDEYNPTKASLIETFRLLFSDKWPKGCTKPPFSSKKEDWDEWLCQADATDWDAFAQLVCLGEVIYG